MFKITTQEPLSAGLIMICLLEARFFMAVRSWESRLWKSDFRTGKLVSAVLLAIMKLAKVVVGYRRGPSRARTKVSMRETLVIARLGESVIFIEKMH